MIDIQHIFGLFLLLFASIFVIIKVSNKISKTKQQKINYLLKIFNTEIYDCLDDFLDCIAKNYTNEYYIKQYFESNVTLNSLFHNLPSKSPRYIECFRDLLFKNVEEVYSKNTNFRHYHKNYLSCKQMINDKLHLVSLQRMLIFKFELKLSIDELGFLTYLELSELYLKQIEDGKI